MRRIMDTVFALAKRSTALVLLYQSEFVLLRAEGGVMSVPSRFRDWWTDEGIEDLIP